MRREGTKIDLGIVKYHFELAAGKEILRGADCTQ